MAVMGGGEEISKENEEGSIEQNVGFSREVQQFRFAVSVAASVLWTSDGSSVPCDLRGVENCNHEELCIS